MTAVDRPVVVAPYAGAWIETFATALIPAGVCSSLPMRERGLKQNIMHLKAELLQVAPYAGAWIETSIMPYGEIVTSSRSLCGSVD